MSAEASSGGDEHLGVSTIKTVTLRDGNYDQWHGKFQAFLVTSINNGAEIKTKLIDPTNVTASKLSGELSSLNQQLHQLLLLSTDGVAYNIIEAADGDGRRAWLALRNKYQANTEAAATELLLKMFSTRYEVDADIDELFTSIDLAAARLKRLGVTVHDIIKRALLLHALGQEFDTVKTVIHAKPTITMDEFKHALRAHYDINYNPAYMNVHGRDYSTIIGQATIQRDRHRRGYRDIMGLAVSARPPPERTGKCNWCDVLGHFEHECKAKKAGKPAAAGSAAARRDLPKCSYHNSTSHTSDECKVLQRLRARGLVATLSNGNTYDRDFIETAPRGL
jgi:hypothetical protein